jgi:RND family efflux transporter MFP subunit
VVNSADLSSLRIERDADGSAGGKRRLVLIVGLLILIALVVTAATMLTRDRALVVAVATAELRGGAGGAGLSANGYVVARTKASVSSKVAGRLIFLGVEEGDRVVAGSVLARLESAEFDALVRQATAEVAAAEAVRIEAQAGVAHANRALERARSLAEASLVAQQQLDDAKTAAEVAAARLSAAGERANAARQFRAAAEANRENTLIRAPFTGTVLRKDAEVGEVVAPSVAGGGLTRGAVVTMADLSTLEVEVDVNEAYIGGVQREQPADIILDAYPTQTFAGHVRQIVPTADRQKATVLVRVAIDDRDARVLPEMGARVVFRALADSAAAVAPARIFVPAGAARSEAGETVVYIVENERAVRRVIEAGPVSGGEREVRRGLSGGETLVLDAPATLVDGARVRVLANDNNRSE